jgi:hypothetical protein
MEESRTDPIAAAANKGLNEAIGETSASMFDGAIAWRNRATDRLRFSLLALPIIPLGLPILYIAVAWFRAGFRPD